mmetsp:Transcript_5016/g.11589  ORF Transcript_5016/g.11589 Transcript_5016/m.11589 type:complete len:830 (-) Transcript_5016:219-2708(-)
MMAATTSAASDAEHAGPAASIGKRATPVDRPGPVPASPSAPAVDARDDESASALSDSRRSISARTAPPRRPPLPGGQHGRGSVSLGRARRGLGRALRGRAGSELGSLLGSRAGSAGESKAGGDVTAGKGGDDGGEGEREEDEARDGAPPDAGLGPIDEIARAYSAARTHSASTSFTEEADDEPSGDAEEGIEVELSEETEATGSTEDGRFAPPPGATRGPEGPGGTGATRGPEEAPAKPGRAGEVDYDADGPTELYLAVEREEWDRVELYCATRRDEASTWVRRHDGGSNRLLFRLLPLHAASVFDAPPSTISALVSAHARAAACRDESGRLPVHLAVRNGADPAVVAALLEAHPKGALMRDREGRTPVDIAGEMSGVGRDREGYLEVLEPYMIAASKADDEDGTADEEREGVPPSASSSVEPSVIKYEQYVPATLCGVEILPLTVNLHDDFRLDRWEDESAVDRAIECEPVLPHGVAGSDRQLNVRVMEIGSVENMTLEQLDTPDPVYTDDVVVMIKCSSITREDCLARRGTWDAVPAGAYVPGTDLVGQVYSMGTEAMRLSGLEVGDRVCATVTDSANAKYVTLPYDRLIPVPRGTGPMAAIGLLSSYVPAQQCLEMAKARTGLPLTGKNVLVVGCDPVALAVLDLCMNEGACVYVSADEHHHQYLTGKGANCLPILPSAWLPEHAGTMDVVVDSVCLDNYESTSRALSPDGVLVCAGQSAVWSHGDPRMDRLGSRAVRTAMLRLWARHVPKRRTVVCYDREESRKDIARTDKCFKYLCILEKRGGISPAVASTVSLRKVHFVHRSLELGHSKHGLNICTPWNSKHD